MLGDRFCMKSGGKVELSPQDMIDCAFENLGCEGGYLIPAMDFLITEGVAPLSCVPFTEETGTTCEVKCRN